MKQFLCLGQTIRFMFIIFLRLHFVDFAMNNNTCTFNLISYQLLILCRGLAKTKIGVN